MAFGVFFVINKFIIDTENPLTQCYRHQALLRFNLSIFISHFLFKPFIYGTSMGFMSVFLVYEVVRNLVVVPIYVCINNTFSLYFHFILIFVIYNNSNCGVHAFHLYSFLLCYSLFNES